MEKNKQNYDRAVEYVRRFSGLLKDDRGACASNVASLCLYVATNGSYDEFLSYVDQEIADSVKYRDSWDTLRFLSGQMLQMDMTFPPQLTDWLVDMLFNRRWSTNTYRPTRFRNAVIPVLMCCLTESFGLNRFRHRLQKRIRRPESSFHGGSASDAVGEVTCKSYSTIAGIAHNHSEKRKLHPKDRHVRGFKDEHVRGFLEHFGSKVNGGN